MPFYTVRARGQFAPLSARYYFDDAISEAGPDAELMFVRGLSFSAGARAEGFISDRQAASIVGLGLENVEDRCKALAQVGLWVPDSQRGGYLVRSWLSWNRSNEEIEGYARRDSGRRRAGRSRATAEPASVSMPEDDSKRNPNGFHLDSKRIPNASTVHAAPGPPGRECRGADAPPAEAAPRSDASALASDNAEVRKIKEKLKNRLRASESRQSRPTLP